MFLLGKEMKLGQGAADGNDLFGCVWLESCIEVVIVKQKKQRNKTAEKPKPSVH